MRKPYSTASRFAKSPARESTRAPASGNVPTAVLSQQPKQTVDLLALTDPVKDRITVTTGLKITAGTLPVFDGEAKVLRRAAGDGTAR